MVIGQIQQAGRPQARQQVCLVGQSVGIGFGVLIRWADSQRWHRNLFGDVFLRGHVRVMPGMNAAIYGLTNRSDRHCELSIK